MGSRGVSGGPLAYMANMSTATRWSQLASELISDGRSGSEDGVARMTYCRAARMTKVASLTELELR